MTADSQRSSVSAGSSVSTTSAQRRMVRYILPANAMIGPYRIEKALGRGGMGEVYLARHVKLNIFRAIKILLPSVAEKDHIYAERFMNEARLAIDMRHPNIINVMDANYDDKYGIYYIVMEYVDGASIRKIIKAKGRFDEQSALKIVLKVAEALLAAEKMKIVHRDIKPDNIMMTTDGEVKLADLGIAKSNSGNENVELTNPQMMLGTIAYISPEQASDAQSVDSRADIYSLGVTLYEMLAAEKPYTGTQVEILQKLFNAPVPNIQAKVPAVSTLTAKLVKKMMAKDKADRPRNFETLCRLLSKLIVDQNPSNQEYLQQAQEMDAQQQKIQEEKRRIEDERRRLSEQQNLIEEARKKISSHDRKFSEERKKVSEERERLSEEQNLIEEEKKRISDHQKRFSAERKRIEEERRRIEDERRRMSEQQKKISEKEQKISAESLRLAEERRQKRKAKIKAAFSAIYRGITGNIAKKVYKSFFILCIMGGLGFLGFYLYQTGVITKSTIDEAVAWVKNQLTPEEMRKPEISDVDNIIVEHGVLTLVPKASDNVLEWLKKNNTVKISGEGIESAEIHLPGKISLASGTYKINIDISGCQRVEREFVMEDNGTKLDIPIIPLQGTVVLSSNKDFEVFYNGKWVKNPKELLLPALMSCHVFIRSKDYKWRIEKLMLSPGKTEEEFISFQKKIPNFEEYHTAEIKEAINKFNKHNYVRSFKLFRQNSEKNPVAAYYLGRMYKEGKLPDDQWQSSVKAKEYFLIAAKNGVAESFYELGKIYQEENNRDALKVYQYGAELGNKKCFTQIGICYAEGIGIAKNEFLASQYFLLAATENDADSQLAMGKICEAAGNWQQAKRWYEKAMANGNVDAERFLEQVKRTMETL